MKSKYPYILAIIFGLAVNFLPGMELLVLHTATFFLGGVLFGFLWPKETWRWGLWIVGPLIALTILSVLFAGNLEILLKKDLPILSLLLASACLGGLIAAMYKHRRA